MRSLQSGPEGAQWEENLQSKVWSIRQPRLLEGNSSTVHPTVAANDHLTGSSHGHTHYPQLSINNTINQARRNVVWRILNCLARSSLVLLNELWQQDPGQVGLLDHKRFAIYHVCPMTL